MQSQEVGPSLHPGIKLKVVHLKKKQKNPIMRVFPRVRAHSHSVIGTVSEFVSVNVCLWM